MGFENENKKNGGEVSRRTIVWTKVGRYFGGFHESTSKRLIPVVLRNVTVVSLLCSCSSHDSVACDVGQWLCHYGFCLITIGN